MKTMILFFVVCCFTLSCSKSDDNNIENSNIVGSWKLTEILADPGDGSGVFNSVSSNKTMTFESNGVVTSNGLICDMSIGTSINSTGTFSTNNLTINSSSCNNSTIKYEQNGNTLTIIYPCFEPCKAKYIKIQ